MKRETLHWSASILKQLFEELGNTSGNNDNNFTVTTTVHVVSESHINKINKKRISAKKETDVLYFGANCKTTSLDVSQS